MPPVPWANPREASGRSAEPLAARLPSLAARLLIPEVQVDEHHVPRGRDLAAGPRAERSGGCGGCGGKQVPELRPRPGFGGDVPGFSGFFVFCCLFLFFAFGGEQPHRNKQGVINPGSTLTWNPPAVRRIGVKEGGFPSWIEPPEPDCENPWISHRAETLVFDDPPTNTNKHMVSHAFKVVRNGLISPSTCVLGK